eukprot:m.195916 g.195916  ORF g.195916 m.195916 type:complete len:71 (+) comp25839_c0_seq3:2832-3044(+)
MAVFACLVFVVLCLRLVCFFDELVNYQLQRMLEFFNKPRCEDCVSVRVWVGVWMCGVHVVGHFVVEGKTK